MLAWMVGKRRRMIANKVAFGVECSLKGLEFFEALTLFAIDFQENAANKVANQAQGLLIIQPHFRGRS
jgi:hypothetical protein